MAACSSAMEDAAPTRSQIYRESDRLQIEEISNKVNIILCSKCSSFPETTRLLEVSSERHSGGAPTVQYNVSAIGASMSALTNRHLTTEYERYVSSNVGENLGSISRLADVIAMGQELVKEVYTARSISDALALKPGEDVDMVEFNKRLIDLVTPNVIKVAKIMSFQAQAIAAIDEFVSYLHLAKKSHRSSTQYTQYESLLDLIDTIIKIDYIKDSSAALRRDVRACIAAQPASGSAVVLEDLQLMSRFLGDVDDRSHHCAILIAVHLKLRGSCAGFEEVFVEALRMVVEALEAELYMLPEEYFRYARLVPHLVLLVDGPHSGTVDDDAPAPGTLNLFSTKSTGGLSSAAIKRALAACPIAPIAFDIHINLTDVLLFARSFDPSSMDDWLLDLDGPPERLKKVRAEYTLSSHWREMRSGHSSYSVDLTLLSVRMQGADFARSVEGGEANRTAAAAVHDMVLRGLLLLRAWKLRVCKALSFRFVCAAHKAVASETGSRGVAEDGQVYPLVFRDGWDPSERAAMADVISLIRATADSVRALECRAAEFLRHHQYCVVQALVQEGFTLQLSNLLKRRKTNVHVLLDIRAIAADWHNTYSRANFKVLSTTNELPRALQLYRSRAVAANPTQLQLLRSCMRFLQEDDSLRPRKEAFYGLSSANALNLATKSPAAVAYDRFCESFDSFYSASFYYPYLLALGETAAELADFGPFVFREAHVDLSGVQFPMDCSLPWLLLESSLDKKMPAPMAEKALQLLQLYDDAARMSLWLGARHLYDEMEAEANLALDQAVFLLADRTYDHFKDSCASHRLDVSYRRKMADLRGGGACYVATQRLQSVLSQRSFRMLGRAIDMNFVIGQNLLQRIRSDVDVAIHRFESGDAAGIIDLKTLLGLLRDTHDALSRHFVFDSFDHVMGEANEAFAPSTFRSRICSHFLKCVLGDLLPNFSYNTFTRRFVRSPIEITHCALSEPPEPYLVQGAHGPAFAKAFDLANRLTSDFFGSGHIQAFLALCGQGDAALLVKALAKNAALLLGDIRDYKEVLDDKLPETSLPKFQFLAGGCYLYFDDLLSPLLDFADLKSELYQSFRELGNTVALVQGLSDCLQVQDELLFLHTAPLLGLTSRPSTHASRDFAKTPVGAVFDGVAAQAEALSSSSSAVTGRLHLQTHAALADSARAIVASMMGRAAESGSLLVNFLAVVSAAVDDLQLRSAWTGSDKRTFYRFWACVSFLFCLPLPAEDGQGDEREQQPDFVDEEEFGHGFSIAGALLLHLMGQRRCFESSDYSLHCLAVGRHELCSTEYVLRETFGRADAALQKEVDEFLAAAAHQAEVVQLHFTLFEALLPRAAGEVRLYQPFTD